MSKYEVIQYLKDGEDMKDVWDKCRREINLGERRVA